MPEIENNPNNADKPDSVNYDDLVNSNPEFSSWLEKRTKEVGDAAARETERKWKVMYDTSMNEAERLRSMTADEKAEYYRKKYEDAQADHQRKENAREMESETASLFSERGIPNDLLPLFNFEDATAETVKSQIGILSKFEFFPKGTFEQKLNDALNEKLRQKPPETVATGRTVADLDVQMKKALEEGNRFLYISLENERAKMIKNKE